MGMVYIVFSKNLCGHLPKMGKKKSAYKRTAGQLIAVESFLHMNIHIIPLEQ